MCPRPRTCPATSARMRSAIGLPLISVADIYASLLREMRWPRKNDAASIDERRQAMRLDGGIVTSVDLEPFAAAAESLVGVAVIPVSAAPVAIELGAYELSADGDVVE